MMRLSFLKFAALIFTLQTAFAAEPTEIPLWEDVPPGSENVGTIEEFAQERASPERPDRRVSGVTVPTITVYRPDPSLNTGVAIVICPGGGYAGLAIDKEGHDIARFLQDNGITAIVLKYRLPRPAGFVFKHDVPWLDASRAVRLTRHYATDWGIDPDRIGILGFSAGGHLASTVATRFDDGSDAAGSVDHQSSRPDFQALIYPVISFMEEFTHSGSRDRLLGKDPDAEMLTKYSAELQVTEQTPPAFLVSTYDDHVKAEHVLRYWEALRAVDVPAEMHIYEVGGHGYGIRPTGRPISTWHVRFIEWLRQRGLVNSAS
jgi:acetyl esterase/lipase